MTKKKIEFISSAFDEKSLKFLKSLKPNYYKIPSGEITNYPKKLISKFNKKILLSTECLISMKLKNNKFNE